MYLLVYTSIVGEWSRELGKDALRVTLFDQRTGCFLGHKTHTNGSPAGKTAWPIR